MRIYTLTFQFTTNFGAMLQTYGLYHHLELLGHDVQVIDYWPCYAKNTQHWYNDSMSSLKSMLLIPARIITSYYFKSFVNRNMKYTRRCNSIMDVSSLPTANAIFVGSDQVWNPQLLEEIDKAYFLDFETDSVKASYAASAGQDAFDEETTTELVTLIRNFDAVSVREDSLYDILRSKGVSNVTHVLDPVFLQDVSVYRSLEKKPKYDNYVLTYYSDEDLLTERLAKKIAKERNCKVLKVGSLKNKDGIIGTKCTSVEEFLGLIDNAECIVTPSFHGVAFSIIFHKDFYAIHAGERSTRIISLLNATGLSNRYIKKGTDIENYKTDMISYLGVEDKLNLLIDNSKKYILSVLMKAEEKKEENTCEN